MQSYENKKWNDSHKRGGEMAFHSSTDYIPFSVPLEKKIQPLIILSTHIDNRKNEKIDKLLVKRNVLVKTVNIEHLTHRNTTGSVYCLIASNWRCAIDKGSTLNRLN